MLRVALAISRRESRTKLLITLAYFRKWGQSVTAARRGFSAVTRSSVYCSTG